MVSHQPLMSQNQPMRAPEFNHWPITGLEIVKPNIRQRINSHTRRICSSNFGGLKPLISRKYWEKIIGVSRGEMIQEWASKKRHVNNSLWNWAEDKLSSSFYLKWNNNLWEILWKISALRILTIENTNDGKVKLYIIHLLKK